MMNLQKNPLICLVSATMMLFAFRTLLVDVRGATTTSSSVLLTKHHSPLHSFRDGGGSEWSVEKIYRTLQVQIVHRHGDRTPITPMKDEDYWSATLVPSPLLEKISSNTNVVVPDGSPNTHVAGGRGAFGKLTKLGLFQLVDLGTMLREELVSSLSHRDPDAYEMMSHPTDSTSRHWYYRYPWTPERPLHPNNIKIISTNFPRTIQSVQGLLVGLFPDGTSDDVIQIDASHTDILIPDPQPRRSEEQTKLEITLAQQPHLKERELEMRPLAIRTTAALLDALGEGAWDANFGVGEDKEADTTTSNQQPRLSWSQLAEITKCLQVRNLLPPSITQEDQETISEYTAWRWFQSLRHPRMAYLAMQPMMSRIVKAMHHYEKEPPVIVYSAHDSTLIGLLCGFRLEQPSVWPEYGSYIKIELLEVETVGQEEKEHVVRFSLNGSLLRSLWDKDRPQVEIPLRHLDHRIKTEGAVAA